MNWAVLVALFVCIAAATQVVKTENLKADCATYNEKEYADNDKGKFISEANSFVDSLGKSTGPLDPDLPANLVGKYLTFVKEIILKNQYYPHRHNDDLKKLRKEYGKIWEKLTRISEVLEEQEALTPELEKNNLTSILSYERIIKRTHAQVYTYVKEESDFSRNYAEREVQKSYKKYLRRKKEYHISKMFNNFTAQIAVYRNITNDHRRKVRVLQLRMLTVILRGVETEMMYEQTNDTHVKVIRDVWGCNIRSLIKDMGEIDYDIRKNFGLKVSGVIDGELGRIISGGESEKKKVSQCIQGVLADRYDWLMWFVIAFSTDRNVDSDYASKYWSRETFNRYSGNKQIVNVHYIYLYRSTDEAKNLIKDAETKKWAGLDRIQKLGACYQCGKDFQHWWSYYLRSGKVIFADDGFWVTLFGTNIQIEPIYFGEKMNTALTPRVVLATSSPDNEVAAAALNKLAPGSLTDTVYTLVLGFDPKKSV